MKSKFKLILNLFFTFFLTCLYSQTISTVAGNGVSGYSGDGSNATSAMLNQPSGIAFDSAGNMYFTDAQNHRIRKVDVSGIITTFAGNGTAGFSGDGGLATAAQLNGPAELVFDPLGNLYVSDYFNNRVRKISTSGIINTIAGNGTNTYSGDGGPATLAGIYYPCGLDFDGSGNLYLADAQNNRIRKVSATGTITTFAGNGSMGYGGDGGPATSAMLFTPYGIKFDSFGNLFIADMGNNVIRKVNSSGTITTVAGTGGTGYTGDGGFATLATFDFPMSISFDLLGNLYISDDFNHCVRKINSSGIISTVAGNGTPGFSGDGGSPLLAQLQYPYGIAFNSVGNLYIGDAGNSRVRVINLATGIEEMDLNLYLETFPNPCNEKLYLRRPRDISFSIKIFDVFGKEILYLTDPNVIDVSKFSQGIYYLQISINSGFIIKKIVKQ